VSTAHILLGLLVRGPLHGYELKREHDARLPCVRPLAFGQVYATLGRLLRDGLVTPAGQDQDSGPERTSFELTDRGRAELETWLVNVEEPARYVQSTLFAKVIVALLVHRSASAARRYLAAQRASHLARMRELTAIKSDPAALLPTVVAADHAIAHLDADLRWMDSTAQRVEHLRAEVRR